MTLYLVRDGIKDVGCIMKNESQVFGSHFHLITYDFNSNEGYIDKKGEDYWLLYTQVGQEFGKSRYYKFSNFNQCVEQVKELNGYGEIIICEANEIEKYK